MTLLQDVESRQLRKTPELSRGDTVRVYSRIKEGEKERVSIRGIVIGFHRNAASTTFKVRKESYGVASSVPTRSLPPHREDRGEEEGRRAAREALLPARGVRQEGPHPREEGLALEEGDRRPVGGVAEGPADEAPVVSRTRRGARRRRRRSSAVPFFDFEAYAEAGGSRRRRASTRPAEAPSPGRCSPPPSSSPRAIPTRGSAIPRSFPPSARTSFRFITADAVAFGIALATSDEIDTLNILRASCSPCGGRWKRSPSTDFLSSTGTSRSLRRAAGDARRRDGRCLSVRRRPSSRRWRGTADGGVRPAVPRVRPLRAQGYPTREHLEAIRRLGRPHPPPDVPRGAGVTLLPEERRAGGTRRKSGHAATSKPRGARSWRETIVRRREIDIVARKGTCSSSWRCARAGTPASERPRSRSRPPSVAGSSPRRGIPLDGAALLLREARFDVIAIEGSGDAAAIRHYPGV